MKVLHLALRGSEDWKVALQQQIGKLTVVSRKVIGVGFYTDFHCLADVPAMKIFANLCGYPPTVNAIKISPTEGLASFIVCIGDDGRISQLEAVSLTDDSWPKNPFEGFRDFQDGNGMIIG